jgi:hypothetical protein
VQFSEIDTGPTRRNPFVVATMSVLPDDDGGATFIAASLSHLSRS